MARSGLLLVLFALLGSCATPVTASNGPFAVSSTAAGGALINAAAAGVLWAVGGGCKLQGCPYGTYCDKDSGFCEVRKCSDGCPGGTVCNEGLGRCQAPGPPKTPRDFLPQDNRFAVPPGMVTH